jgi:hypothetical protein
MAGGFSSGFSSGFDVGLTPPGFITAWALNAPGKFLGLNSMYPRNAASPPRISIGPVVQISDGAVQTSGVSISVLPQGGTASAGSGTVSYNEGVVHYVPTQGETNYTAFTVTAFKSGCIPASVTVVTTASATSGEVVVNGVVSANVTQISGDSTAADNAEAFFDGTGYAGGNNTIGFVGEVLGGINTFVGVITSLDQLDTAQDTQHASTRTVIGTNGASLTALPWNAAWDAEVQSECTDALNAYDPPTKAEVDASVAALLTTALADAYAAHGNAPTLQQAIMWIHQHLDDSAISGTTKTVKKIDGTTAGTLTLDSATSPTSITRAT